MFFLSGQFLVLFARIGSICNDSHFLFLRFLGRKVFFHELAVTVDVLLILVIRDYRPVFTNRFLEICGKSTIFLPGFFLESRIRVRRILGDSGIHASALLCVKPTFCFLDNRLLGKTADQQLVFRHFVIKRFTPFQQSVRILQDPGDLIREYFCP